MGCQEDACGALPKSATLRDRALGAPFNAEAVLAVSGRAESTRARLLAAARILFVTRGYHPTRPQDIAKLAGLGHGTFYVHFPDKLACFMAFAEAASAELGRTVHTALDGIEGFEAMLAAALDAVHGYAKANPYVISTILHDSRLMTAASGPIDVVADRWAGFWGGILAVGQASGAVRRDLDLGFAGSVIVGIIRQGGDYAARHGHTDDELLSGVREMILHAVGYSRPALMISTMNNEDVAP